MLGGYRWGEMMTCGHQYKCSWSFKKCHELCLLPTLRACRLWVTVQHQRWSSIYVTAVLTDLHTVCQTELSASGAAMEDASSSSKTANAPDLPHQSMASSLKPVQRLISKQQLSQHVLKCIARTHILYKRLLHQLLEEWYWVAESFAGDDVDVGDETIAPIQAIHVLPSACAGAPMTEAQ